MDLTVSDSVSMILATAQQSVDAYKREYEELAHKRMACRKKCMATEEARQLALVGVEYDPDSQHTDQISLIINRNREIIEECEEQRFRMDFGYKMLFSDHHRDRYYHILMMVEMWMLKRHLRLQDRKCRNPHEASNADCEEDRFVDKSGFKKSMMIMIMPSNWIADQGEDKAYDWWTEIVRQCYIQKYNNPDVDLNHCLSLRLNLELSQHPPAPPSVNKKMFEDVLFMGCMCYMQFVLDGHMDSENPGTRFAYPERFRDFIMGTQDGNGIPCGAIGNSRNDVSMRRVMDQYIQGNLTTVITKKPITAQHKKLSEWEMLYSVICHIRTFPIYVGYYDPRVVDHKRERTTDNDE